MIAPTRKRKLSGTGFVRVPSLFEWNLWDAKQFRNLKKLMVGKTQEQSLDLLDQWILKKRAWSLFL